MWRKQLHKDFPLFFLYNVYALIGTAARLFVSSNPFLYFFVFWWTDVGFLILGIASLHEGFRSVFEGFYLLRWFRWFYFGSISVVVVISILSSVFNRPVEVHPLFRIVLDVTTPIHCIQAAIFGLFYISVKLFNVTFRRYPFAIVLGFGISAIGTLAPFAIRSAFGKQLENFGVYAPVVAYYLAMAVWLSAFLRPPADEDETFPPLSPQQMANEVTQYTRILKGFLGKSDES